MIIPTNYKAVSSISMLLTPRNYFPHSSVLKSILVSQPEKPSFTLKWNNRKL